jgi:hypothetical protein
MSSPTEITAVRQRIAELLKRVPKKVSAMGTEATVTYKKAVEYASKQLGSPRATFANLRAAETRLNAYQD